VHPLVRAAKSGSGHLARADWEKIFTLNRKIVSCRVAWAWSERVNLYSQQIMTLPTKTKHMELSRAPLQNASPR